MRTRRAYDPAARRRRTLAAHKLSEAQYQALVRRQKGLCDVCAKPLPAHPHVDHDHGPSGRVRGVLCWWCNRLIGNNRNTALMFRRAAEYLESRFDGRAIRPEEWP